MHNQTVNEKLARGVAWTAKLAAATLIVVVAALGAKHFGEGRILRSEQIGRGEQHLGLAGDWCGSLLNGGYCGEPREEAQHACKQSTY